MFQHRAPVDDEAGALRVADGRIRFQVIGVREVHDLPHALQPDVPQQLVVLQEPPHHRQPVPAGPRDGGPQCRFSRCALGLLGTEDPRQAQIPENVRRDGETRSWYRCFSMIAKAIDHAGSARNGSHLPSYRYFPAGLPASAAAAAAAAWLSADADGDAAATAAESASSYQRSEARVGCGLYGRRLERCLSMACVCMRRRAVVAACSCSTGPHDMPSPVPVVEGLPMLRRSRRADNRGTRPRLRGDTARDGRRIPGYGEGRGGPIGSDNA